jgi:hypothetical protein
MKIQLVTPYRASHLQRYSVTIRGNVTSVDPPLDMQNRLRQRQSRFAVKDSPFLGRALTNQQVRVGPVNLRRKIPIPDN